MSIFGQPGSLALPCSRNSHALAAAVEVVGGVCMTMKVTRGEALQSGTPSRHGGGGDIERAARSNGARRPAAAIARLQRMRRKLEGEGACA